MNDFLDVFGAYNYLVRDSLILVVLGLSVYIMLNAGLFAVPQVGFMAAGAYAAGIAATRYDSPLWITLPLGCIVGGLVGILLGAALARLDGVYLAIATIAFSEMARVTIRNLGVTGGPTGLVGIPRSLSDLHIVGILLLATFALVRLGRTKVGAAFVAIREDSLMAAHQGINLRRYRASLFAASGALAGLSGALRVHHNGFVEPASFNFNLLVIILTATILGGMATVAGPWIGSLVVFGLLEVLRSFEELRNILNAVLILVVVAFAPFGVAPLLRSGATRLFGRTRGGRRSIATEVPGAEILLVEAGEHAVASTVEHSVSDIAGAPQAHPEAIILDVSGLSKRFGGVTAVRSASLQLHRGETFGLIGPNGSGKTTMLNLLSGVYSPDSGTGTLAGASMASLWGRPERLTAAGIARTFQNIRLVSGCTVGENVQMGAYLREDAPMLSQFFSMSSGRLAARQTRELVAEALDLVAIRNIVDVDVDTLPYGLKRKVEIARALVHRPVLLLLDEPTAGMSPSERDDIFELVDEIGGRGTTIIVVEHDVRAITTHCDRAAVLNFGEVIAMGRARDVVAEEVVIDAYIGRVARA